MTSQQGRSGDAGLGEEPASPSVPAESTYDWQSAREAILREPEIQVILPCGRTRHRPDNDPDHWEHVQSLLRFYNPTHPRLVEYRFRRVRPGDGTQQWHIIGRLAK